MKTLSIDYGKKKIGLAVSDELGIVSAQLPVLRVNKEEAKISKLIMIIKDNKPQEILFGMPSDREGNDTAQSLEIKEFIKKFEAEFMNQKIEEELGFKVEIKTWDETFSSKNAEKGKSKKFKREKSDSEAARLVLQEYLNSK